MDYTIQKAVELGVYRILPVVTTRTNVKLDDKREAKRLQHWQSVIISACEQCGRNRIPELSAVNDFRQFLSQAPEGDGFILSGRAETQLADVADAGPSISLIAGPEGGFTADEIELAGQAGYRSLCLGPRILRTETAALVGISALQTRWGDLGRY